MSPRYGTVVLFVFTVVSMVWACAAIASPFPPSTALIIVGVGLFLTLATFEWATRRGPRGRH